MCGLRSPQLKLLDHLGNINGVVQEEGVVPRFMPEHIPPAQEARAVCRLLAAGVLSLCHRSFVRLLRLFRRIGFR
jgi:hypothetical protein